VALVSSGGRVASTRSGTPGFGVDVTQQRTP